MPVERDEFLRAVDMLRDDLKEGFRAVTHRLDGVSEQIVELKTSSGITINRVSFLERIVFGLITPVLIGVIAAVLNTVLRK